MSIGRRLVQPAQAGVALGRSMPGMRGLELIGIVSFGSLWLEVNGLVYLLTEVNGLNYVFHLAQSG